MPRKVKAQGTELYLYGDIGYEIQASEFVAALDQVPGGQALTIRISSAGGDVFEGFTIANRIREFDGATTAMIDGLAASMATIIASAADYVVMAEDAWFMVHNPQAVFAQGEADDLRQQADTMDNIADRMAAVYSRRTGQSAEAMLELMAAETWMSAADALAAGFIDEISEPQAALAAHAGFLKVERFHNPPRKFTGETNVKTKLGIALMARLTSLATDETAQKSLIEQIVGLAGCDKTTVELLLEGSNLVHPTPAFIEACASVLGMQIDTLNAEAAQDFEGFTAAPASSSSSPPATPNLDAVHREEGAATERRRTLEIQGLFRNHPGHDELRDECITNGRTVEQSSQLLLNALGAQTEPAVGSGVVTAVAGQDRRDKFRAGVVAALQGRSNDSYRREHAADLSRNEFTGMNLVELARHALIVAGHRVEGFDRFEIVGSAFTTSDFPQILADVANKSLMVGFDEAPETWNMWARIGNLQDFKAHKRAALSEYDDLLLINNGSEEYKRGEFTDLGEDIKAETYGRLFSITRQAIINDDAGAFTTIPTSMGRAANRSVGDAAYNVLFNGQTSSETGNNTYDAAHNNLVAVDLDSDTLDAARAAMATQPGPLNTEKGGAAGAQALNIRPAYLVVPVALEGRAVSVVQAQFEFNDANPDSQRPNPVRNLATPVADARMDNLDANSWILAASGAQHPTIEVGFLGGNAAPRLEQQQGFTTDGTDFKVSIDYGVRVLDWRGLYKSTGST